MPAAVPSRRAAYEYDGAMIDFLPPYMDRPVVGLPVHVNAAALSVPGASRRSCARFLPR